MRRRAPWLLLLLLAAPMAIAPARAADPPRPKLRTIFLIRHGIYDSADTTDDRVGRHLTPLGREQAKLAGRRLAKLPVRMTTLTSSTLTRARETADVMARELKMTPARDSLLSECTPPSSREDIMKGLEPGEADAAQAQLEAAWQRYVRPSPDADVHDVLVCHGNVIRWFTCKALGVDTKQWGSMDVGNGSVTAIVVRPDGVVRLVTYSDVGHIPVAKQTWSGRGWNVAGVKK